MRAVPKPASSEGLLKTKNGQIHLAERCVARSEGLPGSGGYTLLPVVPGPHAGKRQPASTLIVNSTAS
jgi:hypothetical protein